MEGEKGNIHAVEETEAMNYWCFLERWWWKETTRFSAQEDQDSPVVWSGDVVRRNSLTLLILLGSGVGQPGRITPVLSEMNTGESLKTKHKKLKHVRKTKSPNNKT